MNQDLDPQSAAFAARRAEARKKLDALDPAMHKGNEESSVPDPLRRAWFETVYDAAGGDPAKVPWANLLPHPLTRTWIEGQARGIDGLRVLDIGCGLGDNAECLAAARAKVTAFDLVPKAIAWARQRFPDSPVDYQAGDLFALPASWLHAFDLVHECYTLQALSVSLLPKALAQLASLLAPGGKVLLIARARGEDEEIEGPPWPLPPSIFEEAKRQGLFPLMVEDIMATAEVGRRHWRALLQYQDR
ncbi:class I SAM-dependent methyltransferase [Beijerinckia indica]|nr:class I SAM-dependent methyltransferase [Beijerinckia indica]